MSDVIINPEWTLKSLKETMEKEKLKEDICFACGKEHKQIRLYTIAVQNNKFMWTDGSGPVWEKINSQYCDDCVNSLIKTLEQYEIVTN